MYKIEVKNLNVYFGDNHVLKNINLGIKSNKVTVVMGPSGCGKTTLIRTINRMNDLIENFRMTGDVLLDGISIYGGDISVYEVRKRIGMVFQKPNPFPMSIYDNVAYGPRIHGIKNKRELDRIVKKSLEEAALWDEVKDRLDKSAYSLSGGQQQRLCIARCLAVEPEIILMDEPTAFLDPISTSKIESLIYDLKKKYTIVIVTHNIQQAIRVSDYLAFLHLGELIEYGKTSEIVARPRDKRTEDFLSRRLV